MAVYLALGSNIGDRQRNIEMALRMLAPLARVEAVSSVYESAPEGPEDQPPYYDAVCRIVTGLTPQPLLEHVKRIEWDIGRRPGQRWGPRPIDIDILLYDDAVEETEDLVIPHARMTERAFVLAPLLELAPEASDPRTGERFSEVLRLLTETDVKVVGQLAVPAFELR